MSTRIIEFEILPGEVIRIEGLQRDRRRRNDLRITLPDGCLVFAEGRKPAELGWVVFLQDESNFTGGLNLGRSLAYLMGWNPGHADEPEWVDRFLEAVS